MGLSSVDKLFEYRNVVERSLSKVRSNCGLGGHICLVKGDRAVVCLVKGDRKALVVGCIVKSKALS